MADGAADSSSKLVLVIGAFRLTVVVVKKCVRIQRAVLDVVPRISMKVVRAGLG